MTFIDISTFVSDARHSFNNSYPRAAEWITPQSCSRCKSGSTPICSFCSPYICYFQYWDGSHNHQTKGVSISSALDCHICYCMCWVWLNNFWSFCTFTNYLGHWCHFIFMIDNLMYLLIYLIIYLKIFQMAKVQNLGEIREKVLPAPLFCFKMCFCRYTMWNQNTVTRVFDREINNFCLRSHHGWDSIVNIATHYALDSQGIKSREIFPYPSRPALRPTQLPIQWVLGHSQGKVTGALTIHPHLVLKLKKA